MTREHRGFAVKALAVVACVFMLGCLVGWLHEEVSGRQDVKKEVFKVWNAIEMANARLSSPSLRQNEVQEGAMEMVPEVVKETILDEVLPLPTCEPRRESNGLYIRECNMTSDDPFTDFTCKLVRHGECW